MMMFDDKVGGWGWLNDDVIKKYTIKKTLFACTELKKLEFPLENKISQETSESQEANIAN